MARIRGRVFAQALADAGVVSDLDTIMRIVIDVRAHEPVWIHVQRLGDDRLIDLAAMLTGDGDERDGGPE